MSRHSLGSRHHNTRDDMGMTVPKAAKACPPPPPHGSPSLGFPPISAPLSASDPDMYVSGPLPPWRSKQPGSSAVYFYIVSHPPTLITLYFHVTFILSPQPVRDRVYPPASWSTTATSNKTSSPSAGTCRAMRSLAVQGGEARKTKMTRWWCLATAAVHNQLGDSAPCHHVALTKCDLQTATTFLLLHARLSLALLIRRLNFIRQCTCQAGYRLDA